MWKGLAAGFALLLAGLTALSAQSMLPGFPPGVFQSRAAIDASVGAATIDKACTVGTKTASGTSFSYTALTPVDATANAIVAVVIWESGSITSPSLTWDSGGTNQAMTLIPNATRVAGTGLVSLYGLLNPTTGSSKTLAGSWTNNAETLVCSVSLKGVNSTFATAFTGSNVGFSGTLNPSITVSSATNHLVLAAFMNAGFNLSALSGTQLFINNTGASRNGAANYASGAASVAMSVTTSSAGDSGAIVATDISF